MQEEVEEPGDVVRVEVGDQDPVDPVEQPRVVEAAGGPGSAVEEDPLDERTGHVTAPTPEVSGPGAEEGEFHGSIPCGRPTVPNPRGYFIPRPGRHLGGPIRSRVSGRSRSPVGPGPSRPASLNAEVGSPWPMDGSPLGAGTSPASEPVIVLENLRHSYDGRRMALDGVSFSVRRGEVFGLLGRNGAGKSTLIKAMTTLIQPTSGTLRVLGRDPARDGQGIRRRIGVVQQAESFDFTTVQGNLDVYGMLWGIPKAERVRRREQLLTRFGLAESASKRAFDLSGGQKRRVQVAREFMHDMEILFLDEPTVGLDVIMRRTLLDSIREEVRRGLTVVFTTHNLEEADYLCDRVAVIDEGRILVLDALENLKRLYGGREDDRPDRRRPATRTRFFTALTERLGAGATVTPSGGSATILTDDPKAALAEIARALAGDGGALRVAQRAEEHPRGRLPPFGGTGR